MRNQTDIEFSLIIPSRSRMRLLINCIHSFFGRAARPERIEAIVMADFDDPIMRSFEEYTLNNNYNIRVFFQRRTTKMIRDYNNLGAQCSTGKYIWIMNDDYEMVTQNWDAIMGSQCDAFLADKSDRVLYVHVDDSTHSAWGRADELGCTCPILSREAVDIQNGIMPAEIDMWGADVYLYRIFRGLPKNRILNLTSQVKVLHHCRHNGTANPDAIAHHVESVSQRASLTPEEFNNYIQLFSRHLA